jgi:hypothetical protein
LIPSRSVSSFRRAGPRRWAEARGLGLLVVALLGVSPALAGPDAETDALRAELLAGKSDGEWGGVLEHRILKQDAAQVGLVLGPLFRDPALYEANAACVAFTAAFLADHPVNGGREVLLASFVLERAHGDPEFVARVRGHLKKYGGGWERLVEHARTAAAEGTDARVRGAALWFLAQAPTAEIVWFLHGLLDRGMGLPGGIGDMTDPTAREALRAWEAILRTRFGSLTEVRDFLAPLAGASLEEVYRALLDRRTSAGDPDRTRAIELAQRLVAKAAGPDDLIEFLDPSRIPYREVWRAAAKRALAIGARPDEPWQRLFCLVLDRGEEDEVVRGALQLLEKVAADFRRAPEHSEPIARCLATRLQRPVGGGTEDDRARMAAILGRLGVVSAILHAIRHERLARRPGETRVLAQLVTAAGEVEGVPVEEILRHYRDHPGEAAPDREVRLAVANALGQAGIAAREGAAGAAALRAILSGEGVEGIVRETSPEVRTMAIQRLKPYPGPESASVLGEVAVGADPREADTALLVLGGHASLPDASAARVLAEIVQGSAPEERRRAALADLVALPRDADPETVTFVRGAVREALLAPGSSPAIRDEAAAAASRLADPAALGPVVAWWSADPPGRRAVLVALVKGVAPAGPDADAAIGAALLAVAESDALDLAVDLASTLEADHPRPGLRVARGRLLLARARASGREPAARAEDLRAADDTLAAALAADPAGPADEALLLHLAVLGDRAADAPAGADRAGFLLRAVEAASAGRSRASAEEGNRLAVRLDEAVRTAPLDEGQTARFRRAREQIQSRLQG